MIFYYIYSCAHSAKMAAQIANSLRNAPPEFQSFTTGVIKRLSFKVTEAVSRQIESATAATSLNKTDLLKSIAAQIKHEAAPPKKPKNIRQLRMLAAVAV